MKRPQITNYKLQTREGLTLVETILYSTIVTIVVGGFMAVIVNMISSSEGISNDLLLAEEKQFIIQKLDNVLQSVSVVNSPLAGSSGAMISVNKLDYVQNPVVIDLAGGTLRISRGGGVAVPITPTTISVSNLVFEHTATTKEVRLRTTALLTGPRGTTSINFTRIIR